jgi:hypothetical protein
VAKLQNFEECQQYFQTLVFNKSTQDKHERNVSGLTGDIPKGNAKKEGGKKRNKPQNEISVRSYSEAEWKKLTDAQRNEVRALRTKNKNKKRNASGLAQEVQPSPSNGVQQPEAAQAQQGQPAAGAMVVAQVQQAGTQFVPAVIPPRRG